MQPWRNLLQEIKQQEEIAIFETTKRPCSILSAFLQQYLNPSRCAGPCATAESETDGYVCTFDRSFSRTTQTWPCWKLTSTKQRSLLQFSFFSLPPETAGSSQIRTLGEASAVIAVLSARISPALQAVVDAGYCCRRRRGVVWALHNGWSDRDADSHGPKESSRRWISLAHWHHLRKEYFGSIWRALTAMRTVAAVNCSIIHSVLLTSVLVIIHTL